MWSQIQSELFGRLSGEFSPRFLFQPAMALLLAIRAGVKDFKNGRSPFLLTVVRDPAQRSYLIRAGWKDIGRLFLVASAIDLIFQIAVLHAVRPGQTLLVAFALSILPYSLGRGTVNRIAGWIPRNRKRSVCER